MKTAPYPTNNDEMTQDEWVWEITGTTYSVTNSKTDCKCGYRTSGWVNTDIVKCGYEINKEETNFKVLSVNENYSGAGWTYIGGEYYEIVSNPLGDNSSGTCEVTFSVDVKSYIYYRILMNGESGDRLIAHSVDNSGSGVSNYWNASKSYFTYDEQLVSAGTHTICFTYVTDSSGRDYSDNVRIWFYAKSYSTAKTDTYNYVKQLGYYKCGGVDYEPTGAVQWLSQGSGNCPFFNWTFTWSATTEEICGWKLNENKPSITINSVQGNWTREGNTFTSNQINDNEITVERIYFSVSSPTYITFTIDQSSENKYDYLVISNLDKEVVSGSPTDIGSSYNYYHHSGKTTGSTSMTIIDTNEHFIELMYKRDGSGESGRDDVIVTLGADVEYVDTTMYVKMLEYVNKGDGVSALTGNQYYSAKTINCYDCGYKKYDWNDSGEDICCGMLENSENNCTNYYKYNVEIYQVTEDGKTWKNVVPERYRYGTPSETNSEECGYVPKLVQWKLICPDITYETAVSGDTCTICKTYMGALTMFAIEKQQSSTDGGITWTDDYDSNGLPITREEKILKWKADKCGYTGDTFAWFIDKESRTCDGTNQVATYYFKVSSDNGVTWTNVEGVEPEVRIIDKNNEEIHNLCNEKLKDVEKVELNEFNELIKSIQFEVLTDVSNPLLGPTGATYVFSPQKGAKVEELELLENNMKHFSQVVSSYFNNDQLHLIEGTGAAGGVGYALVSFMNAKLKLGIDVLLKNYHFDEILKNYDIVITGEGRLDSQSLNGKVISGIMSYSPKELEFVVGSCSLNDLPYKVHAIVPNSATLEEALSKPKESLSKLIKKKYVG